MKLKRTQVVILSVVVLALTFLVIGVLYQKEPRNYYAHSLRTWQEADSVAGYPIAINGRDEGSPLEFYTAEFEPNLSSMTPLERYRLPLARGFERPADGDARAAATGLVLYAGDPDGYPGSAVLLGHRLPDRSIVQTFYTGLTTATVEVGRIVPRGTILGRGGSLAEIRKGTAIDLACETVAGHQLNHHQHPAPANRLDLEDFLAEHGLDNPTPDPLGVIQDQEFQQARDQLDIQFR